MATIRGSIAILAALVLAAPAEAADEPADRCVALNYLLAQARTDFPALKQAKFNAARCSMVRQQFKCQWAFPGDGFAAANDQASRLMDCTVQSGAKPIDAKRGEKGFQLNPETTMFIRGPEIESGDWTLTLRIATTADWN